jgi:SAM-dependent methyltransferase
MGFLNKVAFRFKAACVELLKIDVVRFRICKLRWFMYRNRLRVADHQSHGVGADTVSYNLGVFKTHAETVFGMRKRMALLLYPTAALLPTDPWASVLIVGPRTEDDILWAWSLGLRGARGLDLFSYSPWIDVGDIHATNYKSGSFDAVLFGWMLAYSTRPDDAIREAKRILKPGGLLGVAMESATDERMQNAKTTRNNPVNSTADLIEMVREEVVFLYDTKPKGSYNLAIIFRMPGPIADHYLTAPL